MTQLVWALVGLGSGLQVYSDTANLWLSAGLGAGVTLVLVVGSWLGERFAR